MSQTQRRQKKGRRLLNGLRSNAQKVGWTLQCESTAPCPLCLEVTHVNDFHVEHIVPQGIGGKQAKTLTCAKCNHDRGGRDLDCHLVNWHKSIEVARQNGEPDKSLFLPCVVQESGITVRGELRRVSASHGPGIHIQLVEDINDKKELEALKELCREGNFTQFNLTMNLGYVERRRHLALIKIAYLAVFCQEGFAYSRHPEVTRWRERILNPGACIEDLSTYVGNVSFRQWPFDEEYVILSGTLKTQTRCHMAFIRTRRRETCYSLVYLPSAIDDSAQLYEELAKLNIDKKQFSGHFKFSIEDK